MNKFTKEIFDGLFYVKENLLNNIVWIIFITFLNILLILVQSNIITSNYETTIEFIILAYLLLFSYTILLFIVLKKLTGYFILYGLLLFVSTFTLNEKLSIFTVGFLITSLIINIVYLTGDFIDEIKKKKPRKSTTTSKKSGHNTRKTKSKKSIGGNDSF